MRMHSTIMERDSLKMSGMRQLFEPDSSWKLLEVGELETYSLPERRGRSPCKPHFPYENSTGLSWQSRTKTISRGVDSAFTSFPYFTRFRLAHSH